MTELPVRRVVRLALLVFGTGVLVVAVAAAAWAGRSVLLIVFAGLLLAIALSSVTDWLTAKAHLPRWLALLLVILALLAVLAGGIFLLAPRIADQISSLAQRLPSLLGQARGQLQQSSWGRHVLQQLPDSSGMSSQLKWLAEQAAAAFYGLLGIVANVVLIAFIGLYFAADPGLYRRGLVRLFPVPKREAAGHVAEAIGQSLGHWLLGKLSLMCLVGVLTAVGLYFLKMPLILSLALLAAALDFIPNIGPIASAVPAVLLALIQGPVHALYVVLLYLGVQVLESYILAPVVQRKAVSLPPALLLGAQVFLAVLLGLPGLLLATPLTVMGLVLTREVYVKGFLEEGKV